MNHYQHNEIERVFPNKVEDIVIKYRKEKNEESDTDDKIIKEEQI